MNASAPNPDALAGGGLGWHAVELTAHRAPMLLLDTVEGLGDGTIRTRVTVDPKAWYALEDGAMPAWFGLELMAQTIATYSGHRKKAESRPQVLGYLLGTQSFTTKVAAFPPGAVLDIEARLHFWDEFTLSAFRCEIRHQGATVASATLKVLEQP
jgi:predicted hotdog family 3-hydroxylacyl-ACP dehydratase